MTCIASGPNVIAHGTVDGSTGALGAVGVPTVGSPVVKSITCRPLGPTVVSVPVTAL